MRQGSHDCGETPNRDDSVSGPGRATDCSCRTDANGLEGWRHHPGLGRCAQPDPWPYPPSPGRARHHKRRRGGHLPLPWRLLLLRPGLRTLGVSPSCRATTDLQAQAPPLIPKQPDRRAGRSRYQCCFLNILPAPIFALCEVPLCGVRRLAHGPIFGTWRHRPVRPIPSGLAPEWLTVADQLESA